MNARYHSVELLTGNETPRLRFALESASNADQSVVMSYQVYDPTTGVMLVDGARTPLPAGLPPGARTDIELPLTIPHEPGDYHIYASPMREGDTWAYERGLPFILASVTVTPGHPLHVSRVRVTDLASLRRKRWLTSAPRALRMPFQTVWRNRSLSYVLVKREILSRSRGSFGGSFWTILNPLLLMLTYFFVFGLVLKSRFGNDPSPAAYALYLLTGMLPWLAFSEAAGRAPLVLIEYRQLIRKIVFPIEMLPVNLVFSGLVGEAFGLILFTLAFVFIRHHIPWTLVFLPVLLIPQMIFTVAFCWFTSALGAFLRDLGQINGFLLTIWFYITPICYPEAGIPAEARWLLTRNPIYILVRAYRAIFLENQSPDWPSLGWLTALSLIAAILAHAWFYKLKKSFADVL